ncbi:MAG: CPBP family intramembrane metalloprotease [Ruminococcus sp.]|jgi:membrane protease YdiL (CAAX protease family)|nr:CPBP family intramembrane metalloprotease [Ruminococcus sp.]
MEKKEIIRQIRRASNINGGALLLFTAIIYGGLIGSNFVFFMIFPDGNESAYAVLTAALNVFQVAVLFGLAFFIRAAAGKSLVNFGFERPAVPGVKVVKYVVITLSLSYISGYASEFILGMVQSAGIEMSDLIPDTSTTFLLVVNLCASVLFAPLFEELLFRGALTGNVSRFGGMSMALAVGISFGFWHENVFQLIYASFIGVLLCWLTMKTGSIYPAIAVHFIFNGGTAPAQLLDLVDTSLADTAYTLYILFEVVVIIAGLIILFSTLLIDKKELSIKNDNYPEISEGTKFFAYFTAPLTVLAIAANIVFMVMNARG